MRNCRLTKVLFAVVVVIVAVVCFDVVVVNVVVHGVEGRVVRLARAFRDALVVGRFGVSSKEKMKFKKSC